MWEGGEGGGCCISITRGVAKASLLWKQTKAGDLGAALSPPPPMGTERSHGGGPGRPEAGEFSAFQTLNLEYQEKEVSSK